MTIYTETTGTGPNIVLLHGGAWDLRSMQPLAAHLEKTHTVTNVNLPGRGGSSWENIHNIDDIADQILAVVPESATYIGWSVGGLIAASIAARFPTRVTHLIGIATTPKFVADKDWPGIPQPGIQANFIVNSNTELKAGLRMAIDAEFENLPLKKQEHQAMLALNDTLEIDHSLFTSSIEIIDAADYRDAYQKIDCAVNLIVGTDDFFVTAEAYPHIIALNPNITVHPIDAGQHILHWTHTEELITQVDSLMANEASAITL